MLRFFNGDDFLRHAIDHRIVYLAGRYGSGKSSLAVALSYFLVRLGLAEHVVSTMPVSWAIPADICPPNNFVALLDEMGVEFDARSFANRRQNEVRRSIVGYLRKINAFAIVSSRVTPDASMRSLTVQRFMDLSGLGLPVELYRYGLEEGVLKTSDWFAVYDRAWLWRTDRKNKSAKYGHEYIPGSSEKVLSLFARSFEAAKSDESEPNQVSQFVLPDFCRWLGLEFEHAADTLQKSPEWGNGAYIPGKDHSALESEQSLHVGIISEKASSGGFRYDF